MLALFNINRSPAGWTKLTAHEGVSVLFPQDVLCTCSMAETPLGPMNCTLYLGRWKDSTASSILAIRDYQSPVLHDPETLFSNWKTDFDDAMKVSGTRKFLTKETRRDAEHARCDLFYSNQGGTNFTRVSLIAQGNRLIILFAVGMLQEVSGQACLECFRSIRV